MLTPSRDKSPKPPRRRSTLVMSNSIISVVPAAVGATTKTRMGLMLLKVRMDMGVRVCRLNVFCIITSDKSHSPIAARRVGLRRKRRRR